MLVEQAREMSDDRGFAAATDPQIAHADNRLA
jgi:hypothetical protein